MCFCHVRAILFQLAESRLVSSRLTSHSTTSDNTNTRNNNNNHNPSVPPLRLQAIQQAADNIVVTTNQLTIERAGVSLFSQPEVEGRPRRWTPVHCVAGAKGQARCMGGGQRVCCGAFQCVNEGKVTHKSACLRSWM